jgi:hypothetical protein
MATEKIYTDKNGTEIKKGMIVSFKNQAGEMRRKYLHDMGKPMEYVMVPRIESGRISRINSKWVNVSTVWGGKCTHKRIPLTELTDYTEEFYENWRQSESYRCM